MERAYLGETGVRVTRIILGCGNFGGIGSTPELFGSGESRDEAFAIMDAAWEAGIRRSTPPTRTAAAAARRSSATGCATKGPAVRDELVLATKTFNPMDAGEDHGLAPARVRRQLESSLRRLGVERVDSTSRTPPIPRCRSRRPPARSTSSCARARSARTALSNVDGAELREALAAGAFGWVQNSYSLLDREAEQEVLPLCARARARLHAVQPARRRLAHRQVPPRRAAAARVADDDAARALRALPATPLSSTSSRSSSGRRPSEGRRWRRSRSPGCLANPLVTAVDRRRPRPGPAGAGARGAYKFLGSSRDYEAASLV